MPVELQVVSIYAAINGHLDNLPVDKVLLFEKELHDFLRKEKGELMGALKEEADLTDEISGALEESIRAFKDKFAATVGFDEAFEAEAEEIGAEGEAPAESKEAGGAGEGVESEEKT